MDTDKQWVLSGELVDPAWLSAPVAVQLEHFYERYVAICRKDGRLPTAAGTYLNAVLARGIRQTWIRHGIAPRPIGFGDQFPEPIFDEMIDELRAVHITRVNGGREIGRDTYANVLMINGFGETYEQLVIDEKRLNLSTL